MFGRRMAGSMIMALVLGAGAVLPQAHSTQAAGNTKVYANTTAGFTISYPANWKTQQTSQGVLFFMAPDQNAFIASASLAAHPNATQVKQVETNAATSTGKVQGKISFGSQTIGGTVYQAAEATIKASDGTMLNFIALNTYHGKYNTLFTAFVALKTKATDTESKQIVASLSSITFK